MKNALQTFEPNLIGRDFVIGDLHGSLSCFENLLKNLNFDKTKDRMFSVGDLVDRGPSSLECLALIDEPWFHCTLSNHEQMMLEAFTGGYMGNFWTRNGGNWGQEALNDASLLTATVTNELHRAVPADTSIKLFNLLKKVEELPFLITLNMKDGKKFHILHAELPPNHGITDEVLASSAQVRKLATISSGEGDFFLWGRWLYAPFYRKNLENLDKAVRVLSNKFMGSFGVFSDKLSHIISGHTIVQHPLTLIGQTNIDTCAYGSYDTRPAGWCSLTCIELDTWTFYQVTESTFKKVEPVAINRADLQSHYDAIDNKQKGTT